MPKVSGPMHDGVQAAVIMLRTLEYLAESRKPVGVTALAQALGTTKSRVHRHLQTLVQQDYVVQTADSEKYEIGPRLVALARHVNDSFNIVGFVTRILQELRDSLGHFAVYSQVEDGGMHVLATVSGNSTIEIGVRQGSLLPFHASAQGKLALAFGSPHIRERVFSSKLERYSPRTIVDTAKLERDIASIKTHGWAVAPDEVAIGLNALAAPVLDANGIMVGAVGIVDLTQFIGPEPSQEQIDQTIAAAERISTMLGYSRDREACPAMPAQQKQPSGK